ncbi:MAG TPA: hydroxysqualene dehydroxylase HpnE [Mycobacteriales bacterium]
MTGRIAVVGGGLAGITAALDLAAAGAEVTLLERRPRLGGATTSFRRGELTVDTGQHVFLRCCTAYRGLIERLGMTDRLALPGRLDVPVLAPGGVRARLRRTGLPAPLHLAGSLLAYRHLGVPDRLRAGRGALALRRLDPADRSLDARTLGDYLHEHGQTDALVGTLWDVIATATLNLPAAEASLQAAARVFRTGVLDSASGGDLGWPLAPLGELHGEAGARALAAAGVKVDLAVAVRAVTADRVATDAGPLDADAVVLAVPATDALALLPDGAVHHRIAELGSSPIVNVHVRYDRRVLPVPVAAAVRSPVQWMFDRTVQSGVPAGQYVAVSLSAADRWVDMPTGELRALFLPALADLLPAARHAEVREFFVTRERRATIRQRAGSGAHRPPAATALPGLLLAGAWTETGWPDTMEGAVLSGTAAARAALDHLSSRPRPAGTGVDP